MDLIVTVFKYESNNESDPVKTGYIREKPLSGIYVTLRHPDGRCESQKTGSEGKIVFNIDTPGQYTVYETLKNLNSRNLSESYLDNLQVLQPVIDGSDTDPLKQVTSTTARKLSVTMGPSRQVLEFGHTVYKPIPCTGKAYSLQSYTDSNKRSGTTILREFDLERGSYKELRRYNSSVSFMDITAFAYNPKEKLLYGIDINNNQGLYRIDGDYKIVKVKELAYISNTNAGDCDNKGNYFLSDIMMRDSYKINLNQNSLNYLDKTIMRFVKNPTIKDIRLFDFKYNNNNKKMYSYCKIETTSSKESFSIIEMAVDLINNSIAVDVINTVKVPYSNSMNLIMYSCFGYDNGMLYFITAFRRAIIYRVDLNNVGPKVLEEVIELPSTVLDYQKNFIANGANCSSAQIKQVANIIYTKTVDINRAFPGQRITYKIVALNKSSVIAKNVKVQDNLDNILTQTKFIQGYYIKNDDTAIKKYVNSAQLKNGVIIGDLGGYEKVEFTIVIEVK